jgi:hypothetical protein
MAAEFSAMRDLFRFILGEEKALAQAFVAENRKLVREQEALAGQELQGAQRRNREKSTGMSQWAEGFAQKAAGFAEMAGGIANAIGGAFGTFVTEVASGEKSLLAAMEGLGRSLLKGVILAVADALLNKAATYVVVALALLAGILSAPLAPNWFIAASILAAAGIGLKMLAAQFMAKGGLVVRPTLAVLGEGGQPEVVIPEDRFAEFGLTGGLDVGTLSLEFPDLKPMQGREAQAFRLAVSSELRTAYQWANQTAF